MKSESKKQYYLELKSGKSIAIDGEKFNKLCELLTKEKQEIPRFIQVNGNLVNVDAISMVRPDSWN